MKIQVCINKNDKNQKKRGDLLEKISKEFLEGLNYSVETEVRNTGMELDLLCKSNANISKKVYVECKAYQLDKKIQADAIKNIVGIRELENYEEVWLISLSELGKEAKGLKEKIQNSEKSRFFTFYTPKEFLKALENNRLVCNPEIPKSKVKELLKSENEIGDFSLLITEYGYFWTIEHKKGGKPNNIFIAYAKDGELVKEEELLSNLQDLDSIYINLNFKIILQINKNTNFTINDLKLNRDYINILNDIGIKLTHPNKNEIFLNDIFCYPDLQSLQNINDDITTTMSSEKLLFLYGSKIKKYMIFGEEISGKTTLLHMLQIKFNEKGFLSLLINAKDIKFVDYNQFDSVLSNCFKEQYGLNDVNFKSIAENNYENLILLIDDFDELRIRQNKNKIKFIKILNDNFKNIIILSDDSAEIEIMTKEDIRKELDGFCFYKIKEYGHKLRDIIIEKWVTLGVEQDIGENDLFEKKDRITKIVNNIIGTKFIQTYPFYIIVLLQQIESGTSFNLGGSAYAEFYNYIINESMGKTNIKPDELDFYHTYLSFVAYKFFIKGVKEFDKRYIEEIHQEYCQKYHRRNFNDVYNNLIKARLVKETSNTFSFGQNYIYYFYVAKYLSDNAERDNKIQEQIDMLIERLYRIEFANIIIFFVHHSKARAESIIDKIIQKAKSIFEDIKPTSLDRDELLKLNSLISKGLKITMSSQKPQDYRQEELETKDKIESIHIQKDRDILSKYDEEIIDLDIFGKTNLSMKLIEIMGQIAKNYYGSLPKTEKAILLNETINLGLTNLNFFIKDISEYRDMLIKEIEKLDKKREDKQIDDKESSAKRTIFAFTLIICFAFIKKISSSISSEHLSEEIKAIKDTNATLIIKNAVNLESINGLRKNNIIELYERFERDKNFIPMELLRIFVIEHLYKFDIKFDLKQLLCKKLNIDINTQNKILATKWHNK